MRAPQKVISGKVPVICTELSVTGKGTGHYLAPVRQLTSILPAVAGMSIPDPLIIIR